MADSAKLVSLLNENDGWKTLATMLTFEEHDVQAFGKSQNPAEAVLMAWLLGNRDATPELLKSHLILMNRRDILQLFPMVPAPNDSKVSQSPVSEKIEVQPLLIESDADEESESIAVDDNEVSKWSLVFAQEPDEVLFEKNFNQLEGNGFEWLSELCDVKMVRYADELLKAVKRFNDVRIVSILEEHIDLLCASKNWKISTRQRGHRVRSFTGDVPTFVWVETWHGNSVLDGSKILLIAVPPNREFVIHTAQLVFIDMRQIIDDNGVIYALDHNVQVWIFNSACNSVMDMMRLDSLKNFVNESFVVLEDGDDNSCCQQFEKSSNVVVLNIGTLADDWNTLTYKCYFRYRLLEVKGNVQHTRVLFIHPRLTLWGTLSSMFANKLSSLGAIGIIYACRVSECTLNEDGLKNLPLLFIPIKFHWLELLSGHNTEVDGIYNVFKHVRSNAKTCVSISYPKNVEAQFDMIFQAEYLVLTSAGGYLAKGAHECDLRFGAVFRGSDSPQVSLEQAGLILQFFFEFDDRNPYRSFGIRNSSSFGSCELLLDNDPFAWSPSFFEARKGNSTKSLRNLMDALNGAVAFSGSEINHLAAFCLFLMKEKSLRVFWAPVEILLSLPGKIDMDKNDIIIIDPRASDELSALCVQKFSGAKATLYKATREDAWCISFSWPLFEENFEEDKRLKTHIHSLNCRLWRHRLLVLIGPSAAGKTSTLKKLVTGTFSDGQKTTLGGSFVRVLMKKRHNEHEFSYQEMGKSPWPSEPSEGSSSLFADGDVPMNVESRVVWSVEDSVDRAAEIEQTWLEEAEQKKEQAVLQHVHISGNDNNVFIDPINEVQLHVSGNNNNILMSTDNVNNDSNHNELNSVSSRSSLEEQEVLVSVWDLGGQRIYYYLQHLMVNRESRAVLVWDGTKPLTKEGVEFWKRVVAPSTLPVSLVVMTRADKVLSGEKRRAQEDLVKEFLPTAKTMWIDNQSGSGVLNLKQEMFAMFTSFNRSDFVVVSKSIVLLLESLQQFPPGFVIDENYSSRTEKLKILAYQVGQIALVEKGDPRDNLVVNRLDWIVEAAATFVHEYRDFENGSVIANMTNAGIFSSKQITKFQQGVITLDILYWLWGYGKNCQAEDENFLDIWKNKKKLEVFAGVDGLSVGRDVIERNLLRIVDVLVHFGILVRRPRKQSFIIPAFAWGASPTFSPFQFVLVGDPFLSCGFVGIFLNRLVDELLFNHVAIEKSGIVIRSVNGDSKVSLVARQIVFQDSLVLSVRKLKEHTPNSLEAILTKLKSAAHKSFQQLCYLYPANCNVDDLFNWKMLLLPTTQNSANGQFFSQTDVFPYGIVEERTIEGVASVGEHTLLNYLNDYVEQKTSSFVFDMQCAVQSNAPILVTGILKEHAESWISDMGWDIVRFNDSQSQKRKDKVLDLPFLQKSKKKWFNTERAAAYWVRERDTGIEGLVIVCPPGRCYVQHVAEMVVYAMQRVRLNSPYAVAKSDNMTRTWNFHSLDDQLFEPGFMNLARWLRVKNLDGAIVVLGYSEFFAERFETQFDSSEWVREDAGKQTEDLTSEPFFMAKTFSNLQHKKVVFLSMRYPFWGEIAGLLVKKLLESNVSTILYGAKLGCISSPLHVLSKIFIPSKFSLRDIYSEGVQAVDIENCLWDPTYASWCIHGPHVSVPTIVSETQLRVGRFVEQYQAASLDNEISFMARSVADFRKREPQRMTSFGAVHYATDCLNWDSEKVRTQSNMTNTDANVANKLKEQQATIINNYLGKVFFCHEKSHEKVETSCANLRRLAFLWREEILLTAVNFEKLDMLWKQICPILADLAFARRLQKFRVLFEKWEAFQASVMHRKMPLARGQIVTSVEIFNDLATCTKEDSLDDRKV